MSNDKLKAYRVHDGEPAEGCVLVFAGSINRAKTLSLKSGWLEEWTMLRVQRQPKWDEYATAEKLVEQNSDLPEQAPRFYDSSRFEADWAV